MGKPILLPYQKRYVEDQRRFKMALWSRQVGKSFSLTLEGVLDCIERSTLWVFLSAGERQSRELCEKAKLHLEALKVAAEALESTFFDQGYEATQLELRLPNKSRMIFLPANPRTARGYSGNVALDEFAFHQDSHAIWSALYPIITRRADLKIRIMSTPNGQEGKFYELWERGGEAWSRHKVTIYDAIADGLKVGADELRAGLADDLAWQQEYLLEFVNENEAFIPYSLITAAEAETLAEEWDEDNAYLGMDIGRKRDLTEIHIGELVGDVLWLRKRISLRNTMFAEQTAILYALLPRVRRACLDATGLGMELAENARRKFGWKVEPVQFSNEIKADLAQNMRLRFEDKGWRIPYQQDLREQIHAVRRIVTPAGNVRYDAERTERNHADAFWALALLQHAVETRRGPVEYKTVQKGRFGGIEGAI